MVRRQAVDELVTRKNLIIAAVHSNPNWDEPDNDKAGYLEGLEASFTKTIEYIYHPELVEKDKKQKEIDYNDPFWSASKRNLDRLTEHYGREDDKSTVTEVVDQEKKTKDEIARVDKMLASLDQVDT